MSAFLIKDENLNLAHHFKGNHIVVTLRGQLGSLLESRRLLKDVQRLQGLADQAEASRIESLHQLIATEFRQLNERVSSLRPSADGTLTHNP